MVHKFVFTLVTYVVGSGPVKHVSSADKELFVCGQHSSMINGLQGRHQMYSPVVRYKLASYTGSLLY